MDIAEQDQFRRARCLLRAVGGALLLTGCRASEPTTPVHVAKHTASISQDVPPNAHYVWCSDPFGCYESAALLCATEVPDASADQHPRRENYRQIAEPGMSAPRAVRDGNEWRMMIVCDAGQ